MITLRIFPLGLSYARVAYVLFRKTETFGPGWRWGMQKPFPKLETALNPNGGKKGFR
jgi:hypothetical protein